MKLKFSILWVLLVLVTARAEVLPPEKLLPADTLAMVTVPDWDKAMAAYKNMPLMQFWHDPAMKPMADKFNEKLKTELVVPLERDLGINLSDYSDLVHGQFTVAITQNGWMGETNKMPGLVVLIDTKDKADQLRKMLADLKKKWIDGGRKFKTETIRDVEFTTLIIAPDDASKSLGNAFPGLKSKNPDGPKGEPVELSIGQAGSLLLVGNTPKDFEKILARQGGGQVSSLADEPTFDANYTAMFREAQVYGWVNFAPLAEILKKVLSESDSGAALGAQGMPKPDKLFSALGLNGVKSVAFNINQSSEGVLYNFFLGVPESRRRGLFKALAPEAKESNPPSFVPGDVAKFTRWRTDGQKLWANLESTLNEVSPQALNMLQFFMMLGKDKDPDFDLKKQLIGNLGDDLIIVEKPPKTWKPADINNPPELYLIGSANPEQLMVGVKALTGLVPPQISNLRDREFLGRKIYSITLPPTPGPDGGLAERSLHFAAGSSYVAVGADVSMLEEFLRSGEAKGKTLSETTGLGDAAEKVGGMGTGWFGYDNQTETFRATLEALKRDPQSFQKLFPSNPFDAGGGRADGKGISAWFDYSLLPPFEKVAKYFYYSVYASSTKGDGIYFKTFSPTPPELKK